MDAEAALDDLPVDAATAHPLAELADVQTPALHFAQAREHAVGLRRQALAQPPLEVGRDAAGQAQDVEVSPARAGLSGALEERGDVGVVEAGDDGRDE